MGKYFFLLSLFVVAVSCENAATTLTELTDKAVAGNAYTLGCTVDPALKKSNVLWIKDGTAVFISSITGYNTIVDVNQTQIHNVFGRYFFNVLGQFQHHLTLYIDPRLDDGTTWMCMPYGTQLASKPLTIHTVEPEGPVQCGWWCIVGSTVGVVLGLLCVEFLFCSRCFTKRY